MEYRDRLVGLENDWNCSMRFQRNFSMLIFHIYTGFEQIPEDMISA
jgi:hypothetical protein